ncbi:MAG TPA: TIGR02996 domain-containing protein [Gemmataceae bacterium]|jgi:uncharacterized protein (TIGR02996 family)|nr:TIGR02996 domain-containing protein [Gemmataceae bacterium]
MITDRAFLQTVLDHPEENVPRLIYADWLEEQGECARAEFIRLQCGGDDPPRQQHLLEQYGPVWASPVFRHGYRYHFRRGFIEEVALQARTLLEYGEQLFHQAPIRLLRIIGAQGLIGRLTQMPQLGRLRALHLTGCSIGDEGVELLSGCRFLTELKTLRLGTNALTDRGVEMLIESPHLHQLQTLVLRDNLIGDLGALLLAGTNQWPNLQSLDVSDNLIGDAGTTALAHSSKLRSLHKLDISLQFKGYGIRPPDLIENASPAINTSTKRRHSYSAMRN